MLSASKNFSSAAFLVPCTPTFGWLHLQMLPASYALPQHNAGNLPSLLNAATALTSSSVADLGTAAKRPYEGQAP